MEKISLNSHRFSLNDYYPQIIKIGVYSGASVLLEGRVDPIFVAVSAFNAISVSFAQQSHPNDRYKNRIAALITTNNYRGFPLYDR